MASSHERSLAIVFLTRQLYPQDLNLFGCPGIFSGSLFVPPRFCSRIRGTYQIASSGLSGIYPYSRIEQLQGSSLRDAIIVFDSLNVDCLLKLSGMLTVSGRILILMPGMEDSYEVFLRRSALQQGVDILDCDPDAASDNTRYKLFAENFFCRGRESTASDIFSADDYSDDAGCKNFFQNGKDVPELSGRQREFLDAVIGDYLLRRDFRLLLTGPRGSGKTLAVKTLLRSLLRGEFRVALPETPGIMFGVSGILNKSYGIPGVIPVTRENFYELSNNVSLLIIEEALALPADILRAVLASYSRVLMVSTDDGYEGSGQGFRHITMKEVSVDVFEFTERFRHRYDRVSEYLRQILFLPDFIAMRGSDVPRESPICFSLKQLYRGFRLVKARDFRHDGNLCVCCRMPNLLKSPLMIGAISEIIHRYHYETSPQDLVRWLRDPEARILMSFAESDGFAKFCSLLVFRKEGRLSEDLARDIFNGERLPPGNLLPQTLLAHAGISCAGYFGYFRVERIITLPDSRRRRHASRLLECLTERTGIPDLDDADIIGTSFAFKPDTFSFWNANGFVMVYAGIAPDTASGMVSAVCIKGTDALSASVVRKMCEKFNCDLPLREMRFPLPAFWHDLYAFDSLSFRDVDGMNDDAVKIVLTEKFGQSYSQSVVDKIREFLLRERNISTENLYRVFLDLYKELFGEPPGVFTTSQAEAVCIHPDMELVFACARNHHSIAHALPDIMRFILLKKDYLMENTDTAYLKSLLMYFLAIPDTDLTAVFCSSGGRRPFFRRVRKLLTELTG